MTSDMCPRYRFIAPSNIENARSALGERFLGAVLATESILAGKHRWRYDHSKTMPCVSHSMRLDQILRRDYEVASIADP